MVAVCFSWSHPSAHAVGGSSIDSKAAKSCSPSAFIPMCRSDSPAIAATKRGSSSRGVSIPAPNARPRKPRAPTPSKPSRANGWHSKNKSSPPATFKKAQWTFEQLIFPRLGKRPIASITAPDLLATLRKIEERGTHETTHRAKQRCGQVFRYAIATNRAERDISADLRGALAPVVTRNRAAITNPTDVAALLRAIDGYRGSPTTTYALKLAARTFVRPGELRYAEWCEVDLDGAEWRIPGERMKMTELHIVPLARQVVEWLRELRSITARSKYLFPALRTLYRPTSENTVNVALRRLGYSKEEMTGHGFRAMASTLLNEQGWHPDVIELQLAHAERNKVRAAYNRAQRLPERRRMMQAWADYLDALASGAKVFVLNAGRSETREPMHGHKSIYFSRA